TKGNPRAVRLSPAASRQKADSTKAREAQEKGLRPEGLSYKGKAKSGPAEKADPTKTRADQERKSERLLGECDFGNCGGVDGVYSGEFDGAFEDFGGAIAPPLSAAQPGERVLEDVHDRDPVGSDFDAADLFPAPHCEVCCDVSPRRARRPVATDAPAEPGDDCVCGDGDTVVSAGEGDRETPGEPVCDRDGVAGGRDCDVVH